MIAIALFFFIFINALDTTIWATLLPQIVTAFPGVCFYPIASGSYLVGFLIASPTVGKITDHFGCKKIGLYALVVYVLGSIFCATSTTIAFLITGRFFQGLAASALLNIATIFIGRHYESTQKRSLIQALFSLVWAGASLVGPSAAVFLTKWFSWRLVFLLVIPISLIGGLFWTRVEEKHEKLPVPFDGVSVFSFIFFALFFFLFLFQFGGDGSSVIQTFLGIFTLLFLLLFIYRNKTSTSSLIPFEALKDGFLASLLYIGFASGFALMSIHTLLSLFAQKAFSFTLFQTGLSVTCMTFGWTGGSFLCSFLLRKRTLLSVLLGASSVLSVATLLFILTLFLPFYSYFLLVTTLLGIGLGFLINGSIVGVQQCSEKKEYLGRLTAFLSMLRSLGGVVGASMSGFLQVFFFNRGLDENAQMKEVWKTSFQGNGAIASLFAFSIGKALVLSLILLGLGVFLLFRHQKNSHEINLECG